LSTVATVLAACGGNGEEAGGGGGADRAETGVGGATGTTEVAQGGTLRIASIAPANPLDPVSMIDLASYAIVAQSYEFLSYSGSNLKLTPGLAESWEPSEDGSVWTFRIRQGVNWQDGRPLTTADIIASFERNIEYGNSGLKGVVESGGITAPDEQTIRFTLPNPNGNLPYLVSSDNPQVVITPKNFKTGSLVDKNPNGTGPWRMESYNQATGARFV
jgi:peptide/nickel transport system substrate-binding protein